MVAFDWVSVSSTTSHSTLGAHGASRKGQARCIQAHSVLEGQRYVATMFFFQRESGESDAT